MCFVLSSYLHACEGQGLQVANTCGSLFCVSNVCIVEPVAHQDGGRIHKCRMSWGQEAKLGGEHLNL